MEITRQSKRTRYRLGGLVISITLVLGCADVLATSKGSVQQSGGYEFNTLVWNEDFTGGSSLNTSAWNYERGAGGWGNNELQYYTSPALDSGSDNVRIDTTNYGKNMLVIEAKAQSLGGASYTSGRITTKGKKAYTYGRFEARMKLPKGQGIWPAFWMLGSNIDSVNWPSCGEIDISEMTGGAGANDAKTYGTLHWNDGGHQYKGGNTTLASGIFNDAFHVFTVEWSQTKVRWYLDGTFFNEEDVTASARDEFRGKSFFLLLNLAVGGNWPGNPDGSTTFPQKLVVDYVRVYQ